MSKVIKVAMVGYDQACCLDISGPADVFGTANMVSNTPKYEIALYSLDGETFNTISNLAMAPHGSLYDIPPDTDTLFIAGGKGVITAMSDGNFSKWLAHNHNNFRRIASVCTGAFLLAQAGLLNHKAATTHWRTCDLMRQLYPDVLLDENAIFTQDGSIYTSAGVTTGIDLALALVESDYGHDLSMQVAKNMVIYIKRPGGQRQFSEILLAQDRNKSSSYNFQTLINWIHDNIATEITVQIMADHVNMSPRNFSRKFTASYDVSPMQFLVHLRLERSRNLIEQSKNSLSEIACLCGFTSYETMRRQFTKRYGISPQRYKHNFSLT